MGYTQEDVLRIAKEKDVKFIRLQFTDIFGQLKNVAPVHRDREGQRNTVTVPVQRIGLGGRAVGSFRHDQLAVMPLGRDAGLAARG